MPDTQIALPDIDQKNSVQQLPDAKKNNGATSFFFDMTERGPLLPARGTRYRDMVLRRWFYNDYNWAFQGAVGGIANVVASKPWEVTGQNNDSSDDSTKQFWGQQYKAQFGGKTPIDSSVKYFQQVFRQADFGRGWTSFIQKLVQNYLIYDIGAIVEVIAPGNPLRPPTGPITGLAILDSLRCFPTGDPEYPIIYTDAKGGYHLMHRSRIMRFVDMPDSNENRPGWGLCALSRSISLVQQQILESRYVESKLDDKPPPGVVVASGIMEGQRATAVAAYREEQNTDEMQPWGRQMWFYSMDAAFPIDIKPISFTQAPDKWDYKQYTELLIDAFALTIGVDKQDLWQMTTGSMGSSGQSKVMAQKSRGKTIGILLSDLERQINDLMPEENDFGFTEKDPQAEAEKSALATAWAGVTTTLKDDLSADERRKLLASQVEPIKDAISDENGKIQTADAAGVTPPEPVLLPPGAAGAPDKQPGTHVQNGQGGNPQPGGAAKQVRERSRVDADMGGLVDMDTRQKAIQATRLDFEADFADLIDSRIKGDINASRFGVLARAQLRKYGLQALRDGLEDGGVSIKDADGVPLPLEDDEQAGFNSWLMEQSVYVTAFGKTLTAGNTPDVEAKAELWFNNSVRAIYNDGVMFADKNGMYQRHLGQTEEHCADCPRLDGQVHRLRNWNEKDLIPPSAKTECGGWYCECYLTKTTLPVSGGY